MIPHLYRISCLVRAEVEVDRLLDFVLHESIFATVSNVHKLITL